LRLNSKVQDVAVIGVPHERFGEVPRAYVVRASEGVTEAELHEFVNAEVAEFKQLRGGLEFIKQIPKSPSGKILRRELKAAFEANATV